MSVSKPVPVSEPKHYQVVEDTCWPVNAGDVQWLLRYQDGQLTRSHQLLAASVISAYEHLTDPSLPQYEAVAALKRARKAAVEARGSA